MLKIRLKRVGRKNDPSFRVVLTDSKKATKKGALEVLGSYNPRYGKPIVKAERVNYWISVGAQPSDTVHNLLVSEKVITDKKRNVLPKKSPIKKDVPAEEAKKENDTEKTEKIEEVKKEVESTDISTETKKEEAK